jgi:hypothetical protein
VRARGEVGADQRVDGLWGPEGRQAECRGREERRAGWRVLPDRGNEARGGSIVGMGAGRMVWGEVGFDARGVGGGFGGGGVSGGWGKGL